MLGNTRRTEHLQKEDQVVANTHPAGTHKRCVSVCPVCVCVTCVRLLTYKEDSCRQPKVRGQRESVGHAQEQS